MRYLYTLLFIFLFSFGYSQSTSEDAVSDSSSIEIQTIDISEINSETEKLSERFSAINKVLQPNSKIISIDSTIKFMYGNVSVEQEKSLNDTLELTYRKLETEIRRWEVFKDKIKSYNEIVKGRSDELQEISNELFQYLAIWDATRIEAEERELSKDVIESIDGVKNSINDIILINNQRSDSLFVIQKKITEVILIIDDVKNELQLRESSLRGGYFVIDSPDIWHAKDTTIETTYIKEVFIKGVKKDKEVIVLYIKENIPVFIMQLLMFLLLTVGMFFLKRKGLSLGTDENIESDRQYLTVLKNPVSVILVIGILITVFFYSNRPLIMGEFAIFILFFPTIVLLPQLFQKKFRGLIVLMFFAYILYLTQNYVTHKAFAIRVFLYLSFILIGIVLLRIQYYKPFLSYVDNKWRRLSRLVIWFYLILLLIGLIANTIGAVNLALAINGGLITSISLGFIVLLFIIILINISLMILKSRMSTSIETIGALVEMINIRLRPFLEWVGFLAWLSFTLMGFDIFKKVIDWLIGIFSFDWEVGGISISVGGIVSFFVILIVTFALSKAISNVLRDDWVINTMPKGSSSGTSMVLRIIVVSLGFYFALSAAGIDLGKLGFIVGALGVGIGFGLQSVVLNFIAGLILAFERPIIVGDVIMADLEMGVVTEIGVRASKLKLYDGSEVIIPNGDLISKKVTNYTLSDYKRRSKIIVRTAVSADPNVVIEVLNAISKQHEKTLDDPLPKTYFKGYGDSSLDFHLLYWTQFDDKFSTDSKIAIDVYNKLKEMAIHLPIPMIKIEKEKTDDELRPDKKQKDL